LPGRRRVGEIYLDFRLFGKKFVFAHFSPAVACQTLSELRGNAKKRFRELFSHGERVFLFERTMRVSLVVRSMREPMALL
jgi:hypothetical protein